MTKIMDSIELFLKGFLMGMCDIMPGVSGGTIALITGIYDTLIGSISKIKFVFLKPLLKGNISKFKTDLLEEVNFEFFIPLVIGIAIAMIIMSGIISFLLANYAAFTYSLFAGLILASIYILYKELNAFKLPTILTTILFTILGYVFVGLNPIQATHSLPILFISGFIAICAMLLPGISGAFVLLLLGQYQYMINALHSISIIEIIIFVLGAGIGIMTMSRVIKYLLNNHKQLTVAGLIGIMLGSMRIPLNQILIVDPMSILICVVIAIIGMILILFMESRFHYNLI